MKNNFKRYFYVGILMLVVIFSSWQFFQPEKYLDDASALYYENQNRIRESMSEILPDYIPAQMAKVEEEPVAKKGVFFRCEVGVLEDEDSRKYCNFEFTKLVDKTQQKLVAVDSQSDTLLEFAVADFPGWTVEIDGVVTEHRASELGTILVPVEAGKHNIGLEFRNSRVRAIADGVSLFGLVIFLSIYFWYHGDLERKLKRIKLND